VASDLLVANNYATLGYPADLHFGTDTSFSISLWIKMAGWDGDQSFIATRIGIPATTAG